MIQFAISIGLIAGTDIVFNQLGYLNTADVGFIEDGILVVPFYWEPVVQERYFALKSELLMQPTVENVTASGDIPGRMFTSLSYATEREDGPASGGITSLLVDTDFATTYGVELLAGRDFSGDRPIDMAGSGFVLNEAAVMAIGWDSPQDAVGRPFSLGGKRDGWWSVWYAIITFLLCMKPYSRWPWEFGPTGSGICRSGSEPMI